MDSVHTTRHRVDCGHRVFIRCLLFIARGFLAIRKYCFDVHDYIPSVTSGEFRIGQLAYWHLVKDVFFPSRNSSKFALTGGVGWLIEFKILSTTYKSLGDGYNIKDRVIR